MGANRRKWIGNAILLLASTVFAIVVAELVLRIRYADPGYARRPEVEAVQAHLRLHPELGFTWQPDINAEANIVFEVADVDYEPLCTDDSGFSNGPEAIARKEAGEPIDVIGLGDSFMEHGAHELHKLFAEHGLFYYSMAIHRQCPPQYNIILETYALPHHPKWIVYGLFENDFEETDDFARWRASSLDWFAYHSGTWCGPPLSISAPERFLKRHFRGMSGFARVLRERFGEGRIVPEPDIRAQAAEAYGNVKAAYELAASRGARLVVLLIPSKELVLQGSSLSAPVFDALAAELRESEIPLIDLREPFTASPNPATLYYEVDGHWNRNGIDAAATLLLRRIAGSQPRENASGE